jgi:hypothetical protein
MWAAHRRAARGEGVLRHRMWQIRNQDDERGGFGRVQCLPRRKGEED